MKLFFNISLAVICVSAQNQACMDRCGSEVDRCHELCEYDDEASYYCHEYCHDTMCRCFKSCGCPECCEYWWEYVEEWGEDAPQYDTRKSFADETFQESEKSEVSQFLRKKSNFRK